MWQIFSGIGLYIYLFLHSFSLYVQCRQLRSHLLKSRFGCTARNSHVGDTFNWFHESANHQKSFPWSSIQNRLVTYMTVDVHSRHPQVKMQLLLSPDQLKESFMPFHSSEYDFSQNLYFGFLCAVVLVFSCPVFSRVINTQDARPRLLKTEQDKYKQGKKTHVFWGLFFRGSFATGRMNIGSPCSEGYKGRNSIWNKELCLEQNEVSLDMPAKNEIRRRCH